MMNLSVRTHTRYVLSVYIDPADPVMEQKTKDLVWHMIKQALLESAPGDEVCLSSTWHSAGEKT